MEPGDYQRIWLANILTPAVGWLLSLPGLILLLVRAAQNGNGWHFFVLARSICHYLAVLFYVIP